jgi:hypothetical protein
VEDHLNIKSHDQIHPIVIFIANFFNIIF